MALLVDLLAQFDIILIAIMLSGIIVKMGRAHGTTSWDSHFKSFYFLFCLFIIENVLITLFADYLFLPFFEDVLFDNYSKMFAITADLVLFCNIWFAWTFGYKQRIEIIALTVLTTIVTIVLFLSGSNTQ